MIKSFLILTSFSILLFSSQQLIVVTADDFNTSHATLQCYEDGKKQFKSISVNIGAKGLGWGLGSYRIAHKADEPVKHEGDKKAPAGIFKLTTLFGYSKSNNFHFPYLHATQELICVDDTQSPYYNTIKIKTGDEKSFEYMRRDDQQYRLGIVVQHNKKRIKQRGSCIFMHVQKAPNHPTLGCTSMPYAALEKISRWLDKEKNPLLIQLPKQYMPQAIHYFPSLKESY